MSNGAAAARPPAPGLPTDVTSFYRSLGGGTYQPTEHVEGVWNPDEQHMGPVSGLLAHAIENHEPREDLALSRLTFDVLGVIPARPSLIDVHVARPGRTIELVEAAMTVGGRTVVRAQGWRLARGETSAVAGGMPEPMLSPAECEPWSSEDTWSGGYFAGLELRRAPANVPGRGQVWIRTPYSLLEGVTTTPTAAYVALVDTANGVATRVSTDDYVFPSIDLTVHLYRQPDPEWVGLDTTVVFGSAGVGLTSTVLHDLHGPVGRAEQILTVRKRPAGGG